MNQQMKHVALSSLGPVLFLGIVAATQTCAASVYLKCPSNFLVYFLSIFLSVGVYMLNRTVESDSINYVERSIFFVRHKWLLLVSIAALVVPVVVLLATRNFRPLPVFILGSLIGVLYSVKILPFYDGSSLRWISIKRIPVVKNISVSLLWGGSALAIVALMTDTRLFFRPDVLILFACFTLLNMNSTIASDIRDIEGDRFDRLTTVPTLLGLHKTFYLLSGFNLAGIAGVVAACFSGIIPLLLAFYCISCIIWSSLGILPFFLEEKKMWPKALHEVFIDSHLLVSSLGLILISLFT
jgi:4-hydroxybenzoate polyprenyltransferase